MTDGYDPLRDGAYDPFASQKGTSDRRAARGSDQGAGRFIPSEPSYDSKAAKRRRRNAAQDRAGMDADDNTDDDDSAGNIFESPDPIKGDRNDYNKESGGGRYAWIVNLLIGFVMVRFPRFFFLGFVLVIAVTIWALIQKRRDAGA